MAGQVEGKVALVTGGASGIGEAIAELLAQQGATVVATDIDELRGPEVAGRITKAGGKAVFLEQDVTSEARWAEISAEVERRFGRLDIMVSNAGIGIAVPSIVDMTLADWRKQTAINLDGVFLSVKYCLPLMRKSGGGSIIMMSSLAGLRGAAGLAGYSATKGPSACSPRRSRWNAPARATASASIRCIPALSTRRSGARFRPVLPATWAMPRSIRRSGRNWRRRWDMPVGHGTSPTACFTSLPMRRAI
jgi:NADP-dependent 3-hydroxy acid dehydrogenase YdfG